VRAGRDLGLEVRALIRYARVAEQEELDVIAPRDLA
jgi:hypothetical protein